MLEAEEGGPELEWGSQAHGGSGFGLSRCSSILDRCLVVQGSCLDSTHRIHIPVAKGGKKTNHTPSL